MLDPGRRVLGRVPPFRGVSVRSDILTSPYSYSRFHLLRPALFQEDRYWSVATCQVRPGREGGDGPRGDKLYKKPAGREPGRRRRARVAEAGVRAPTCGGGGDMGRYSGKTCRLLFMLVLTVAFFVAELVSGYLGNSIALLSDSFNMLSDLISLCVGLAAGYIARRAPGGLRATYGYGRAEVVGALSNAVFLTALCFTIFVEAVLRLARPERIDDPELVLIVGALGLAVNVVGLLIFQDCAACFARCGPRRRRRRPPPPAAPGPDSARTLPAARPEEKGATVFANVAGDSLNTQNEPEETMKKEKKSEALNIRGVLLHVMGDALGSVVVVVTAIIFYVRPLRREDPCNWQCYIDPSLTVVMVIIILSSAFPLIKETAVILLQMVPKGLNMEELMSKLSAVPGISSVHEVHVWELISGKIIATLHIKYQKDRGYQEASTQIREIFHKAGIHNVTIQFEELDLQERPEQKDLLLLCSSPCVSKVCTKHLCCPPGTLPLAHVNGCAEHNGRPPLDAGCGDSLCRREAPEVAIEVSLDGRLCDHGQAVTRTQEDQHYVNSTHF
ncbi:Zinc transporter 10 [Galemys pyrenaicus]|uniref:Zinc transporter 10 n=1 Tax=Galemys pyrenaicus TaxID=202257 RepID=A0A8J6DQP2_GALPY|nr:Zinc transporter 10 [Galemys pyrenaicus]